MYSNGVRHASALQRFIIVHQTSTVNSASAAPRKRSGATKEKGCLAVSIRSFVASVRGCDGIAADDKSKHNKIGRECNSSPDKRTASDCSCHPRKRSKQISQLQHKKFHLTVISQNDTGIVTVPQFENDRVQDRDEKA